jgi:glycogen(starch) synthase
MKILVYNDVSCHVGGAETFAENLIEGARERGHEVELFSCRDEPLSREGLPNKIRYVYWNQLVHPSIVRQMDEAIRSFQPDLIHCHNNYYYTSSIIHSIRKSGVPMVGTLHDNDLLAPFFTNRNSPLKYLKKRQFRKILHTANLITSPTRKWIRKLKPVHETKFTYLPLFVDFERWQFNPDTWKNPKKIAFLGRIIPDKGVFVLLEAMRLLVQQDPEVHLTYIGGGGSMDELKAKIKEYGLEENISLTGYIDLDEVFTHLNASRLLVLASVYVELFGLVGIEAQALGLPVIAADVGGISEWCLDGETGFLYSKFDAEGLSEKIKNLMDQPEMGREMAQRAYQHISEEYSRKGCIDRLMAIYEAAAENKTVSPSV